MPGIVVGVDGSGHSRKALERAIQEAAAHHTSLTVLTVHQVEMFGLGVVGFEFIVTNRPRG